MDVNFMDHGDRTMAGVQFASAGFFLRAHFLHRAFARARAAGLMLIFIARFRFRFRTVRAGKYTSEHENSARTH